MRPSLTIGERPPTLDLPKPAAAAAAAAAADAAVPPPPSLVSLADLGGDGADGDGDGDVVLVSPLVGVFIAYIGMAVFNVGLNYGLDKLGDAVGAAMPSLFHKLAAVPRSPLLSYEAGLCAAVVFTFFLGLCATLAEPALNCMGRTTQRLTRGEFTKRAVMGSVALGVAAGVVLGILRMIMKWHLATMIILSYSVALVLTVPCDDMYVCVAWDAAGVTTGSITVPLVLAMGLGLGEQLQVHDAFGVLSMASVGPIISVLSMGLWLKNKDDLLVRFPLLRRLPGVRPSGFREVGAAEQCPDSPHHKYSMRAAAALDTDKDLHSVAEKVKLLVTDGEDSVTRRASGGTFGEA